MNSFITWKTVDQAWHGADKLPINSKVVGHFFPVMVIIGACQTLFNKVHGPGSLTYFKQHCVLRQNVERDDVEKILNTFFGERVEFGYKFNDGVVSHKEESRIC